VVGRIGVEPLRHGPRREAQGQAARGGLDGLEVEIVDGPGADQVGEFPRNFRLERRTEPPFSPPGASDAVRGAISASARRSQASQYSSVASRNCRPVSICRRTVAARSGAMSRVCVVPATDRVRLT
jgi:hypothetical protein